MKIIELVAKVEKLSMQEIDELVDNGIEIEDIQYILLHDDKNMDETLFKNEKLKNFLLKRINEYVVEFFEDIKNNPTLQEKTELKSYSATLRMMFLERTLYFLLTLVSSR